MKKSCPGKFGLKEAGSLTLTFCLLLPVVFSLLIVLFDFSMESRKDLDLTRWLAANLEVNLAAFDRQLWQDFGLLALNETPFSTVSSTHFDNEAEVSLQGESSLYEPGNLKEEILRHMKIRFPAELITGLAGRIRDLGAFDFEGSIDTILSSDGCREAKDLLQGGEAVPDDVEWKEELDEYIDAEINSLYEDVVSSLMPVHIYDEQGDVTGGGKLDFFDPESMSRIAAFIDETLAAPENTSLDKLYLASYALDYFPAVVEGRIVDNKMIPRLTPDGRSHADLLPQRSGEAEEIITGSRGDKAGKEVRAVLIVVRSIIQLIHHFQDESLRNRYKIYAGIIVAAVAAISAGSVSLPLEAVEYLLLLADAVLDGRREAVRLQEGHGVSFWPGKNDGSLVLYYHDYLLLFLIIQKEEALLSRFKTIISRHNPGPGWVWLSATTNHTGKAITFDGGYLSGRYRYAAEGAK